MTEGLAQIYDHVGTDLTPVAVFGDPEACVQGVREVIDAGAEMILFTPLHDEAGADGTSGRSDCPAVS